MATIITGLFEDPADASAAIHSLEAKGVPLDSMSLVASDAISKESFAIKSHTKLPEGVAVGGATGAAVGALVAGFTAVGAVATGGAGLLVAGPAVAAAAGAGAGAAGGGALGGLVGVFLPEHEVKHYEDAIEKGSVLVGVECGDDIDEDVVKETLEHFDASKVSTA